MGPTSAQLTYAFAYITYAMLFAGAMFGVQRSVRSFMMIPRLAEPNRYPDVVASVIATRFISGMVFIGINTINLSIALSVGVHRSYLFDSTQLLSYVSANPPSNDQVALALLTSSMLRMAGTMGLMHAANAFGDIGHRDEHIRKRANHRVIWGILAGVILWTPEFWTELGGQYFEPLRLIANLLRSANVTGVSH